MSTHLICIRENKKNIRTFGLKKSALFEAYVDTQTVQAVRTYSSSKKFWTKNLTVFLTFQQKHVLWVLMGSSSLRHFL